MPSLTDFINNIEKDPVAYAYELAKFSVFDDAPDRQITDWGWRVDADEPAEDDWKQDDVTEHRIRNITPLVHGAPDTDNAMAYKYTYVGYDGETTTTLGTDDPRGDRSLVRCTPLVPSEE